MTKRNYTLTLILAFVMQTGVFVAKAEKLGDKTYTATECNSIKTITNMLLGPGVVNFEGGYLKKSHTVQTGVFSNLVAKAIPSFTNGVILSTGDIAKGSSLTNFSAHCDLGDEFQDVDPEDADVRRYYGRNLNNPTGFVLYIRPKNKTINIPFVMASEEFFWSSDDGASTVQKPSLEDYEERSDKFLFFLSEIADASDNPDENAAAIQYELAHPVEMEDNIALLPGGEDDVQISTVNQYVNTQYFISNVVSNDDGSLKFPAGDIPLPMEFNGAIVGPVAVAEVDPSKIYKLKVVIGDEGDYKGTSAVFFRACGITSGADLKIDVSGPVSITEPDAVTFTNTVSNIGSSIANGVVVTNYLPVGATEVTWESDGVGTVDNSNPDFLVWDIGSGFAPGSNAVLKVNCTLSSEDVSYTNRAIVATSTGDYDESNNTDECETLVGNVKPLLTITAIITNKFVGTEMTLDAIQFIKSIKDSAGGSYTATGIDVTFTNDVGEVAYPTNAAAVAGMYGIYLSNVKGLDLSNMFRGVQYEAGSIKVKNRTPMQIKVDNLSKIYDGESLEATYSYTTNALVDGDVLQVVLNGTPRTNAGSNDVTVASYAVNREGVDVTSEYEFNIIDGSLNVEKRPLTIWIRRGIVTPKPYGQEYHFWDIPGNFETEGLVDGEGVTLDLASLGASASATCGVYRITAENLAPAAGTDLNNYDTTINPGTLRVNRAPITIAANDVTNCYGEAIAFAGTEFTIIDGELKNGNQVTNVNIRWQGDPKPGAGEHLNQISPFHAVLGSNGFHTNNYDISFADGKLVVTQAVLTITANSKTRPYGTTIPILDTDFTTDPQDLPYSETVSNVSIACPEAAMPLANIDTYPITTNDVFEVTGANGFDPENYDLRFKPGVLTVTPTEFRLTAESVTKYYDGKPTNIVVKVQDLPEPVTPEIMYSYAETEGYVSAAAFTGPTNVEESAEVWCRVIAPGTTKTVQATVTILPRVVVEQADSAQRPYNGEPLTNDGHFFEGTAASNLAQSVYQDLLYPDIYDGPARSDWSDAVGFTNLDGIVTAPMTADSTITDPGTTANVINSNVVTFTESTKTNNYVVRYLDGRLMVTRSEALTLEVSAIEKFYDATPTNVAYVVKIDGTPIDDATVCLREKGTETWIPAADFPSYCNATNVTVEAQATKHGYVDATTEATVYVKPRIVVHHASDGTWEYDGIEHTQSDYFEDTEEEAKRSKERWGTDEALPNSTGFVAGEGYAARLVMTAESSIKEPGKKPNAINRSAEAAALKEGTNPVNYELLYLDGELEVTSTAILQTQVSANLNWNTGLLDLTLTVKNVGTGAVYSASNYWVELVPGPAETGTIATVQRTYYLDHPTGKLMSGADYVDLTEAVKNELLLVGNHDMVFDRDEEVVITNVSVYHWKRWSPELFIDFETFFVAGRLSELAESQPQQKTSEKPVLATAAVNSGSQSAGGTTDRADTSSAVSYDGTLYSDGVLSGTLQVKLAKANKKTGLSRLTATLAPVGEKKITMSGSFDPDAASFVATAKDGRTLELVIGRDGLFGAFGTFEIEGARNRYSSKDASDKAIVAAADEWIGAYSLANSSENGWETYTVSIAKKGKVKISGTLADGSTISASAQMIVGSECCCIPVVCAKKSVLRAFCIWLDQEGVEVSGLEDAVFGAIGNLNESAMFALDVDALVSLLENDEVEVLTEYLPDCSEIASNGSKWIVMPDENGRAMKSGKLVWNRREGEIDEEKSKIENFNVSGLKLNYTAKTGKFNGSFKAYSIVKGALKTTSVSVAGVVVDGVGYGFAKVGKADCVAVTIE